MSIFVDDYGIVDCSYLVHAAPVDPRPEHGEGDYRISYALAVCGHAVAGVFTYPSRAVRDGAFERLVACTQQWVAHCARVDAEEEDEDEDKG